MKDITILGSTGSIGTQCLEVVRSHREEFRVTALTAGRNVDLFRRQLAEFRPAVAAVAAEGDALSLMREFPGVEFTYGIEGISQIAGRGGSGLVLNGLMGMMGIRPTYEAARAGRPIALANKETLVAGGRFIMDAIRKGGGPLLPVDSEHSAIFQALQGNEHNSIKRIILTASGGPFRGYTAKDMRTVTREQALKHPKWSMGAKITIDSATMMNKGLEVMEASWLFDVAPDDIQVVVHPESILHSAVEYEDGSVIGQMGLPDMKVPIAYALSYPNRMPNVGKSMDLFDVAALHFEKPDREAFACLDLAYKAMAAGKSYAIVLNAANEEAVAAFLSDRIPFFRIPELCKAAMDAHEPLDVDSLDSILDVESWTRRFVKGLLG